MGIPLLKSVADYSGMELHSLLSTLRKRKGLTQADLAERVGVNQPAVQRWESGAREPNLATIRSLAENLGVPLAAFFGELEPAAIGPVLRMRGEVAAGVWREAFELPDDEHATFTGRSDVTADLAHRFGLRVIGDSMDELYPPGSIVECVSVFGHIEPSPGRRVVVLRTRSDGNVEATVKELVEIAGELWARPRSHNPSHVAFNLSAPGEGVVEARVIAVVVGAIIPENGR